MDTRIIIPSRGFTSPASAATADPSGTVIVVNHD
jgi:hypothetical protein